MDAPITRMSLPLLLLCTCIAAHSSHQKGKDQVCVEYVQDLARGHEAMIDTAEYNVITKTVMLNRGSPEEAREEIKQYFIDSFDLDTSLFLHIRNELRLAGAIKQPHNKYFESTFAVGVDENSWDDQLEDRDDWPLPDEVYNYRQEVRDIVLDIIETQELELPIAWDSVWWALLMGIEHQRIHVETSSVLIRQLPLDVFYDVDHSEIELKTPWNNTCRVGAFSSTLPQPIQDDVINFKPDLGAPGHAPHNELIAVKGKHVTYGRKIDDFSRKLAVYGWDNEYGEMSVDVPSFKASKYLVSNEEFYEFVLDGGYTTRSYWTDEGWRWVQSTKPRLPKFWVRRNNTFYLRNMLTEIELPWNWPVVTNHLEGLAFTRWKSFKLNTTIRLLTEDEWLVLRQLGKYGDTDQPFWDLAPGNINLEYYASECPVDMFEFGGSGFYDIVGNVWHHTLTPQHPFDGFEVHAIYDDFSVPCFGRHHNLLKGGSWISTGNEAIASSRQHFRRHFYQHAGIRYVESDRDLSYISRLAERNPYDDDGTVQLYTHFGYAPEEYLSVPNYPKRIADLVVEFADKLKKPKGSALDIGCATGRTVFELAKGGYEEVIGIDYTTRLIGVGYRMQENAFLEWTMTEQGQIEKEYRVSAEELGFDDETLQKVTFIQNDAQNLDPRWADFDLIVASNLIDRLLNPALFLSHIHERCKIGGLMLLCDPYTWSEQFAARTNWIGGIVNETTQQPVYSEDAVKKLLLSQPQSNWKALVEKDVPLVMKETSRKYQYLNTHCMLLERI